MKNVFTLFNKCFLLIAGIVILSWDGFSQQVQEITSVKGQLIRITPKLSEIDRNSMYGEPFVIKRNEKGIISHQTKEIQEFKKAFKEMLAREIEGGDPTPGVLPAQPTPNVATTTINYNADGIIATGISPSDNNMAVGPNHIIQMINHASGSLFTVRSKTGAVITPPTVFASLTGQPGAGDPIVLYDYLADRWLMSEFDDAPSPGGSLNIAISATNDPTGSWFVYRFSDASFFPDYPKYGIWHNAYYASSQDYNLGTGVFFGSSIWAFDRTAMLAGNPSPTMVRVRLNLINSTTTWGLCVVSLEGTTPSTQGGLFAYVYDNPAPSDTVGIIEFIPNFSNPPASIVQPPQKMATLPFALGPTSAPTPGGGTWATLRGKVMFKPTYRRFSTHESIVLNVTANDGTGRACIKWFELRRTTGNWFIHQEGLYAPPDGIHRYMGTMTISSTGNIALMYNASSATVPTSLRYTARNDCDPPGQMTLPEQIVISSTTNPPSGARNGDYNSLAVDPSIPNSFWGVGQYNASNGTFQNWATRIVNFTIGGGCAPTPNIIADGFTLISESCVPANGVIDPGETVTVSFCLRNNGTANTSNAVGTLQATGGIISPSGPQNYGVIVAGGTSVCRQFTFTNNSSTCQATITASIQVQDGPDNLGVVTFPITLGTTTTVTSQNFDAVTPPTLPAGWTASATGAAATLWVTSNSGTPAPPAFSNPNAAYVPNPANISDNILQTPAFTPGPGSSVLFRNNYTFENGNWDGGVLEISVNSGPWQDILAAGGTFVSGGYTGTIASGFGNPLAGRQAWTNSSGGFILTRVNLPSSASGQSVRLRFRMGTDNSVSAPGWRIDDFTVTQPVCCGAPCTLTCPSNITVNANPNQCGANVTYPPATTSGLCGPITYSHPSGSFFPVGTTTVTVTSQSGNTCTFTVTVVDNTPPTATCPANITTTTNPGICGAVVNYNLPTVTDNCPLPGAVSLTQNTNNTTITAGTGIACSGGDNHFWRAYSLSQPDPLTITGVRFGVEVNSTAQVATVNVYTSAGPFPASPRTLIATGTVNITTTPATFYTVNFANPPTVPGNAIVAIEVVVPTGGMWPGANSLGQSAPAYISSATCGVPTPQTLASLGFPNSHTIIDLLGTVPVTPPVITQIAGLPSGSTFPVGTTTNTFRVRDAANNISFCSFTVTVNDNEAPTITCPANQVRNTDPGQCYATFTPPQPTFADNCAVTRLTWTMTGATTGSSPNTGINFVPSTQFLLSGTTGTGVTTITYTATDAAGNSRTCSFTVTVNDASIPVITGQPATRYFCEGSNATFTVTASAGTGNPLAYQWQQWNGTSWVNISGATAATLTVPSVTIGMNTNTYRCVLTGRCSQVTSSAATLFVNPLPRVTLTTSIPPSIVPGQSLNIISSVSLPGGTYQWFKNNQAITSPLAQGPVLSNLTVDDIGTYRLVYTDPNGCVGTSNDIVVSGKPDSKLWVYPVPNTGRFQVRFFNTPNESATIRVFDSKGALVFERTSVTTTPYSRLDVDLGKAIPDGTYVVELYNSQGNRMGSRKILVKK
ncbi:MAG: HYR domain-containing protein [Chitinophagaceae bacterium]|nr:HYR domain-containing protein [Chitinophagaceae bacterium]